MKNHTIYLIPTLLALAAFAFVGCEKKDATTTSSAQQQAVSPEKPVATTVALPRLIDLGSVSCIPCKMMAPVLEDLKTTRANQFTTDFYDVWQDKSKAEEYKISIIPTQIFFDKNGKELFRHEGFYPKEDILKKWRELGYAFDEKN